jgi:hypothetical protein
MAKRIPLEVDEHRELGERLKQLEREVLDIMHILSDRVSAPISTSWRKKMGHIHEYQSQLEKEMLNQLRKKNESPPEDWGLIYYGPVESEKKTWVNS